MKIKIVTDSTCNLPWQLIKKHNISVVDVKVIIDEKVFKDSEIKAKEVAKAIKSGKNVKTSQTAVEDFIDIYDKSLKEYDHIISIHLSSKTSGTINAANLAAKTLKAEDRITIFDSRYTSLATGLMVLKACELVEKNQALDTILQELETYSRSIVGYFVVGDLDSLIKGGRIGKIKGRIAALLKVKPIFTMVDGEIDIFKITLGEKRGLNEMLRLVDENINKIRDRLIGIVYLNTEKFVKKFVEKFGNKFKYLIVPAVPSLAAHAGSKLFAIIMSLEG